MPNEQSVLVLRAPDVESRQGWREWDAIVTASVVRPGVPDVESRRGWREDYVKKSKPGARRMGHKANEGSPNAT